MRSLVIVDNLNYHDESIINYIIIKSFRFILNIFLDLNRHVKVLFVYSSNNWLYDMLTLVYNIQYKYSIVNTHGYRFYNYFDM